MTPLIAITVILVYFAAMLILGWLSGRRSRGDFYTGGGSTPGAILVVAMIGAAISGVTFVSVPGMVAGKGFSYLQMALGFVVGYWVIARILVPLFFRQGVVSIYSYLNNRFGLSAYRSGAWLFFISKLTGAGVRFLVVCVVLQGLVFGPLGMPFEVSVMVSIALIWLYTRTGGVGAVVWTDVLRTVCLVGSVVLAIFFIAKALGMGLSDAVTAVAAHPSSHIFYFDDPASGLYFWKQFVAGIFMVIAMTGLDQDMMQRTLTCADARGAGRSLVRSGVMQLFVIGLFLVLGVMLMMYVEQTPDIEMPERTDELFSLVANSPGMPVVVGVVFLLGLVSAAYSAAGSALTSLTTSFTIDILGQTPEGSAKLRPRVHAAMGVVMGLFIIIFYRLTSLDAISAVYTLASYTYGPLLGLFAFGMFSRRRVVAAAVPVVCLAAPVISGIIQWWLDGIGYQLGFELLLLNALLTVGGLMIVSRAALAQPVVEPQN